MPCGRAVASCLHVLIRYRRSIHSLMDKGCVELCISWVQNLNCLALIGFDSLHSLIFFKFFLKSRTNKTLCVISFYFHKEIVYHWHYLSAARLRNKCGWETNVTSSTSCNEHGLQCFTMNIFPISLLTAVFYLLMLLLTSFPLLVQLGYLIHFFHFIILKMFLSISNLSYHKSYPTKSMLCYFSMLHLILWLLHHR